MQLAKSILVKYNRSLFLNKYSYKIVLVSGYAWLIRNNKLAIAVETITNNKKPLTEDAELALAICRTLQSMTDYSIRIEHPYLNVYTNDDHSLELLSTLSTEAVKYVSMPNPASNLIANSEIVKNLDYAYKIYIGNTNRNHASFVEWATDNDNVRLSKRCILQLTRDKSYGGIYIYAKNQRTLTMVQMFLGSDITRISSLIKA